MTLPRPYYQDGSVTIYHGDCRDASWPVDALLVTDPPYGVTDHEWDVVVPAKDWMRCSAAVVFAAEPFATALIMAATLPLAYDLVWVKNTTSNQMNAARQPLRDHERVLLFGRPTYRPMKVVRTADEMARLNVEQREKYPEKFAGSVLRFDAVNNRHGDRTAHPSQKPVELMRWLIEAYSAPDDLIVDPFMGSGTTLRAAKDLGRRALGVEREERFCEIAVGRMGQDVLFGAAA